MSSRLLKVAPGRPSAIRRGGLPPGWRTSSLRRSWWSLGDVPMPRPHPPEFRQRALELARWREKPLKQIAADLGISESCLRGWIAKADVEDGRRPGVTRDEHEELTALRRELRVAKMENEILKRAAAFFAQENVLPK